MAAYIDAQANNNSDRNLRQYSDLDLFFGKKVSDQDVNKVTDVQAVKRSIRNLVLLNHYEKPFHPEIASGVSGMLFELMSPITGNIIARKIEKLTKRYQYSHIYLKMLFCYVHSHTFKKSGEGGIPS